MVYPVNETDFQINTAGRSAAPGTFVKVADMETFSISFDNGVEEWYPMDTKGWARRLMTAKSITIGMNGKRHYGDPGNDYIASMAYLNGNDCNTQLKVTFPDGSVFQMDCVANVTNDGGGDSTNVGGLDWECMSDGKPTYTPSTP